MTWCPLCGAQRGDEEGFTERLIAGLHARDTSVVQHAADILGERGDEQAVPELIRVLETNGNEFVLESAARALGKIGDKRALGSLCRVAGTGPRAAREAACVALARLGAVEALPMLRQVIGHLGSSGLRAIAYLEGRAADPPADASERWQRRPAMGGDPMALVREAARFGGCVICTLMADDLSAFMAQWQYFSTLAPAVRERFCQRKGFCAEHTEMLRRIASPQGLDLGLMDLLAAVARAVTVNADASPTDPGAPGPDGLLGHERQCQACELCREAEVRYLQALGALARDQAFRQAYAASRGICIPHFVCLCEHIREPKARDWTMATQGSHIRRLVEEMQGHLRKCEAGLRRETTSDEEQAAWRALRMLSGRPEVKPGISRRLPGARADERSANGR